MPSALTGSNLLITGGTGSFGKAFLSHILANESPRRVVVYSRDELKQYEMAIKWKDDNRVRFFLGDVRDRERLSLAFRDVDLVVHAAALKQVDTAEYNPMEFIKTNIIGSENVIRAAVENRVSKVVALSTDKASSPVNLYGATKLAADKLFISSNNYALAQGTTLSVVRYGNVMGSRGSVIPLFRDLASRGEPLPITDMRMTRFWITLDQASKFVVDCFDDMGGGELYVPRIPSMRIIDLARAIAPNADIVEMGIRPGEKLHEEMIAAADAVRTVRKQDRYVVAPTLATWGGYQPPVGEPVQENFSYSSDSNDLWLSVDDLRAMIASQSL